MYGVRGTFDYDRRVMIAEYMVTSFLIRTRNSSLLRAKGMTMKYQKKDHSTTMLRLLLRCPWLTARRLLEYIPMWKSTILQTPVRKYGII